jgi:hypothetical protein
VLVRNLAARCDNAVAIDGKLAFSRLGLFPVLGARSSHNSKRLLTTDHSEVLGFVSDAEPEAQL